MSRLAFVEADMGTHRVADPRGREGSFAHARVTFERVTDVPDHCPQCRGLLTRRLGPGVLCACCDRLWVIRELLGQEAG